MLIRNQVYRVGKGKSVTCCCVQALLDRAPGDNTLIVTGSHALGNAIKQAELSEAVLTVQTNPNVLAMNAHLAKYCKQHGIHYFDPFALSTNSSTFDGQHHSGAVNTLKVNLLPCTPRFCSTQAHAWLALSQYLEIYHSALAAWLSS